MTSNMHTLVLLLCFAKVTRLKGCRRAYELVRIHETDVSHIVSSRRCDKFEKTVPIIKKRMKILLNIRKTSVV
jgi:hypothetical protein